MARQEAIMQEARVKRVWAILLFFTQIDFIVFTYLVCGESGVRRKKEESCRTAIKCLIFDGVNIEYSENH
jgi:hypothetical protein